MIEMDAIRHVPFWTLCINTHILSRNPARGGRAASRPAFFEGGYSPLQKTVILKPNHTLSDVPSIRSFHSMYTLRPHLTHALPYISVLVYPSTTIPAARISSSRTSGILARIAS